MSVWKKIKNLFRKLAGKDLPKSVTEEHEWVSPKQPPLKEPYFKGEPPDINIEKQIQQRIREEWLPKPTTKRKTHDKTHRPPAAEHDISRLMEGKGGRHSRHYHQTIKKSPHTKIEEEEN